VARSLGDRLQRLVSSLVPGTATIWFVAGALLASVAHGQEHSSNREAYLEVTRGPGTESCPDAPRLRRLIGQRLGYDPFAATTLPGRGIRIALARNAGHTTATLTWIAPALRAEAKRQIGSDEAGCDGLTEAVVLAVCLSFEPFPAEPPRSGSRSPEPSPPEVARPASADRGPGWIIGFAPAASWGALPASTLELSAFAGARWSGFYFELGAAFDLPVTTGGPGNRIRTSLALVDAAACFHLPWHLPLAGCGTIGGGFLQADGPNFSSPSSGKAPYSFVGARLLAVIPLGPMFELWPSFELRGALARTTLSAGPTPVWTTPPVSGQVGLALVATLGPTPR
jgi:hypothetical protein